MGRDATRPHRALFELVGLRCIAAHFNTPTGSHGVARTLMPDSDSPRFLGLITARGGSKRVPRKNLLPVAGKPLLAWTVEAATSARRLDRLVLSTDDSEIAAIGRQYGADVPFERPAQLASDTASGHDVIVHALAALAEHGDHYDYVVVLQPTSPLRTAHFRDPYGPEVHFASESFVDEMAFATETDPLEFRLARVTDERDAAVLVGLQCPVHRFPEVPVLDLDVHRPVRLGFPVPAEDVDGIARVGVREMQVFDVKGRVDVVDGKVPFGGKIFLLAGGVLLTGAGSYFLGWFLSPGSF